MPYINPSSLFILKYDFSELLTQNKIMLQNITMNKNILIKFQIL